MDIALSVLLIGTAIVCIYYWVDFYITGGVHVIKDDWYMRFQNAFPAADLWMSVCAIVGAIGLLTGQTYGLLFTLLAASSLIFLGLMDVTFNIQNKLYRLVATSGQMKFEVFLNIYALGFGIALIICLGPRLGLV
ncbi:MAG TPA: hypothetical protein G4O18_02830 [Dehalococcoidia bacterium]|nr:hypothetical protein [Dehalococcoidia bacterium]